MNYKEFVSIFKEQVSILSQTKQLHLAVDISKQLFFDYQKFFEVHHWGDPDLLMDAIRICEQSQYETISNDKIADMITKIDLIIPDTENFGDNIGSYALNAATTVYETLQFLQDKDQNHIYNIGIYYTDTIDFKIQEKNELSEYEIQNHPFMHKAWNFIIERTKEQ